MSSVFRPTAFAKLVRSHLVLFFFPGTRQYRRHSEPRYKYRALECLQPEKFIITLRLFSVRCWDQSKPWIAREGT